MRYVFIDESGGVDPFSGSRFLIVVALVTGVPRPLALHIKRARRSLGRKARPDDMRAATLEEAVVERLLRTISEEPVEIVAVIVNKQVILRPPEDPEDIYREAVTRTVAHCVARWPRLETYLDKRYTKPALRRELERVIREGIAGRPQEIVLLFQEDSRKRKELQAADHVAWALFQKYERGDDRFYQLIRERIVVEEVIEHFLW